MLLTYGRRQFLASLAASKSTNHSAVVLNAASGAVITQVRVDERRIHPGSAVKPFVGVALLDAGATGPVRCSGALRIGSRRLDCTHPPVTEPVELTVALAYSCNSYFVSAAMRLTPEQLTAGLRRFGLDVLPGNARELMTVGESGVSCTLMELAQAYRRLASARYPAIHDGLLAATEYGTAQLSRPKDVVVAGKTGTSSQPPRAIFAGWAPADQPRIVVAVQTPGGRGGVDAAPIAKKLFEDYL